MVRRSRSQLIKFQNIRKLRGQKKFPQKSGSTNCLKRQYDNHWHDNAIGQNTPRNGICESVARGNKKRTQNDEISVESRERVNYITGICNVANSPPLPKKKATGNSLVRTIINYFKTGWGKKNVVTWALTLGRFTVVTLALHRFT